MALWAALLVVFASVLASAMAAAPSASTYTLTGYVHQPGGASAPPVPAGVQVDLVSRATGAVFTTTVAGKGGGFTFSSASSAPGLQPGYWEVYVPAQTNVTLAGSKSASAILPETQNPSYAYYNLTQLTNTNYATLISNVAVYPYNATLNGTVEGGLPVPEASVRLLDPSYNGLVIANTTTNSTGNFTLPVPEGSWILQASHTSGSNTYTNTSRITISSQRPPNVFPILRAYAISGYLTTGTGFVPNVGNATLYDPTNHYVYSTPTPPGGYYALTPYPSSFTSGPGTFDVILSAAGYGTTAYATTIPNASSPVHQNMLMSVVNPSHLGVYNTTLDLTRINTVTGRGTIAVNTTVRLGNDSVIPNLPNATVGQLWAQLGLDLNHSLVFPKSLLPSFESWLNASGPWFPAVQAATAINGTQFVGTNASLPVSYFSSTCAASCGLGSASTISFGWNTSYTLNGTAPKSASSYSLTFGFQHPESQNVYNYTVVLPSGYQLAAQTAPPAHTLLEPAGPGGTWTKFTLVSKPGPTVAATATFDFVKYTNLTANVNVSSSNFTFSSSNILNSTHGDYTVVAGVGENLTFSAINSTYPAGTNGTLFSWYFGDRTWDNTSSQTTNHTYTVATLPGHNYSGTLTITSSGGLRNSTNFSVYVVNSRPTASITSNATATENKTTVLRVHYLLVNWGTTLQFNATNSSIASPNNLSIASFTLTAKNFKQSANFSRSQGADPRANWTVQFLGAGTYLSTGNVNGTLVPIPEGWQYTLNLTVWTMSGTFAKTSLVILVNDTQKPTPSFLLQNINHATISSSGVVVQPNGTAQVRLDAAASVDPNNGSIAKYYWHINNSGNSSVFYYANVSKASPFPVAWLTAQPHPYTVNLTITDLNGNVANTTESLTVSVNTSTTPIMQAADLNGPTTLNEGTSYTFWVNISNAGGSKSVATGVKVTFYLLSASGSGSRNYIGNSPSSVVFYNYTSAGVVNTASFATGSIASLAYNKTVRAVFTWNPSVSGNFILYANVTASNQYLPDVGTSNVASQSITVHPNQTTLLLEYAGVVAVLVLAVVGLIWWFRRPRRAPGAKPAASTGKSGLERGPRKTDDDEDDDQ